MQLRNSHPAGLLHQSLQVIGLNKLEGVSFDQSIKIFIFVHIHIDKRICHLFRPVPALLYLQQPLEVLFDRHHHHFVEEMLSWWVDEFWQSLFVLPTSFEYFGFVTLVNHFDSLSHKRQYLFRPMQQLFLSLSTPTQIKYLNKTNVLLMNTSMTPWSLQRQS